MANRSSLGPVVLVLSALSCTFYVACGDDDVIIGRPAGSGGGDTDASAGAAGSGGTGGGDNGGTGGAGTGGGGTGGTDVPDATPPDAGDGGLPDAAPDTGASSNN
jgi:hypothetical protein